METPELYRLFVSLMAAFLHGETVSPTLSAADWGKLYALAKRQSLSGALHAVVGKGEMPDAVRDRLRRDAFLTLANYETQQQVLRELTDTLTAAKTAHLVFKGAVTRRYYRDPAMRSMGDIDAAIRESSRPLADAALTAAGFEVSKKQPAVWVYTRRGTIVEVHTELKRYNTFRQTAEAYEDFWVDTRLQNGTTHHFSDEAEAAYTLSHMAAHFCGGGCGLRQLMDVAVLLKRFPDAALWQGVITRLEPLGTDRFARHMLWLCETWFGVEAPEAALPLNGETEEQLRCRLLDDGTFGLDDRRMLSRMRRESRVSAPGGTGGTWRRWLFPSASYLRGQYGYAENPLLLPVAYVHRLVDGVTKNRRVHTARLKYAKEQQDTLQDEIRFFETIGL